MEKKRVRNEKWLGKLKNLENWDNWEKRKFKKLRKFKKKKQQLWIIMSSGSDCCPFVCCIWQFTEFRHQERWFETVWSFFKNMQILDIVAIQLRRSEFSVWKEPDNQMSPIKSHLNVQWFRWLQELIKRRCLRSSSRFLIRSSAFEDDQKTTTETVLVYSRRIPWI